MGDEGYQDLIVGYSRIASECSPKSDGTFTLHVLSILANHTPA